MSLSLSLSLNPFELELLRALNILIYCISRSLILNYPYLGDETKVTESGSSHSTPPLVQFANFHDHDNASQLDSTESKGAESIPNQKQLTFVKA